jgi:CrcB protein
MKIILLVGTGGFVGSISRYLVSQLMQKTFETTFPLGTLVVNIVGSFLIGIIYALSEQSEILSAEWRVFLAVGFCEVLQRFLRLRMKILQWQIFSSFCFQHFILV